MTHPELPQNIEAERATLGSILLNREAIAAVADWLVPDYFYLQRHGWIYEAMLACYDARIPPDTRMVSEHLRRQDRLEPIGGIPYLSKLVDSVPTSYHIAFYAKIVERTALLRAVITAGGKIAALGYEEQEDVEVTLDKAEQIIFAVAARRTVRDYISIGAVMDAYYERIAYLQERADDSGIVGVPTGFRDLDEMTGGLQRTDFIILAARPSQGKTSCAMSMAYNMATGRDRLPVGVFSLEMSSTQLGERLLAMDTGIPTHRLRTGRMREPELLRLMESMGRLAEAPIFIEDTANITLAELRSRARRMRAKDGIEALFIDYLQLIETGNQRAENRVQQVSLVSRSLKALARELNIPVIALSQLSRAVEGRQSKDSNALGFTRRSGALEQDADVVMFIYREEAYDAETDKKGIAEIIVAKHRNGPVGIVPLRFDTTTTKFQNLAYVVPPPGL